MELITTLLQNQPPTPTAPAPPICTIPTCSPRRMARESYHLYLIGVFTTSPIWSGVECFIEILISLFPMACIFMILLNMHLFSWRLVVMMSLSLQAMMICTLLRFPVNCWLEMASKNCWSDVGYFMPILRIQELFLFLDGNAWFHGLLFSDL